MTINQRIRMVIEEMGLNTRSFAKNAGIDPAVLHNIVAEGGRLSKPSFDILEKIMLSYDNINPDFLLTGTGSIFRDFKNEMYIKQGEKGGSLISPKGGSLKGSLIENEMYIKPESKAYDTEKHHRDPGSVSDPQETYYLDLKKLITRIEADKSTLLSHLLDRMHSMELQIQELTKKAKK